MTKKAKQTRYAISRQSRLTIIVLSALIALFVIFLDRTQTGPWISRKINSQSKVRLEDIQKYDNHSFIIQKAVDGDTIDINSPDNEKNYTRIRLWGVDTPETKDPRVEVGYFGPEASEFTKQTVLGKKVTIYLDKKQTRDKYDRLLAYIQLIDGKFLNELLLSEGFAYADRRFKHQYYYKYLRLESAARREKKGLWANVTREQFPQWLQEREPHLLEKK